MNIEANEQRPSKKTAPQTKTSIILKALQRKRGATLDELCVLTGWKRHSMRGHLSGALRRKRKLEIVTSISKTGIRRYRLDQSGPGAAS